MKSLSNFLIFVIGAKLSNKIYGKVYVKYCKKRINQYYLKCYGKKLTKWQWKMDRFALKSIIKLQKERLSEYYSNEECMRFECKNKRGKKSNDRIKFLMCEKCKIASYCSRRCAKLDWNTGHHKMYCELYYH